MKKHLSTNSRAPLFPVHPRSNSIGSLPLGLHLPTLTVSLPELPSKYDAAKPNDVETAFGNGKRNRGVIFGFSVFKKLGKKIDNGKVCCEELKDYKTNIIVAYLNTVVFSNSKVSTTDDVAGILSTGGYLLVLSTPPRVK